MPFFVRRFFRSASAEPETEAALATTASSSQPDSAHTNEAQSLGFEKLNRIDDLQLVFHCQLAHGSATCLLAGFHSPQELYSKIEDLYDLNSGQILYCTLNTPKVEMLQVFDGHLSLDDFIYAHLRGQAKEIELTKPYADCLGLIISDNGAGFCYIRSISSTSLLSNISCLKVGDHIECINDELMVGKRHYEVAKILNDIPSGSTFSFRLVEPIRKDTQYSFDPRHTHSYPAFPDGREILRFKHSGASIEPKLPDHVKCAVNNVGHLLACFLNIQDDEIALQIWELGMEKKSLVELHKSIQSTNLAAMGLQEDFAVALWQIIAESKCWAKHAQLKVK